MRKAKNNWNRSMKFNACRCSQCCGLRYETACTPLNVDKETNPQAVHLQLQQPPQLRVPKSVCAAQVPSECSLAACPWVLQLVQYLAFGPALQSAMQCICPHCAQVSWICLHWAAKWLPMYAWHFMHLFTSCMFFLAKTCFASMTIPSWRILFACWADLVVRMAKAVCCPGHRLSVFFIHLLSRISPCGIPFCSSTTRCVNCESGLNQVGTY
jgi:hypothetical protein